MCVDRESTGQRLIAAWRFAAGAIFLIFPSVVSRLDHRHFLRFAM